MIVTVLKEASANEKRVAATPATVERLIKKLGFQVRVETNAGSLAGIADEQYIEAGAEIAPSASDALQDAAVVLKVRAPIVRDDGTDEIALMPENATLISFIQPGQNEALLKKLQARPISTLAMDMVPRITRAQKLDALSSMANIAGYRAVVESANLFGRFFTGQITAAGKMPPAKVLVIGAGVAGLAAIGAARSLGAIVRAFDTRPAVKEQVESMGAEFLELSFEEDGTGEGGYAKTMSKEFIAAEMQLFKEQAQEVDVIITTALIPGKAAPKLILEECVDMLKPGSVVMDLAAEAGGNCVFTEKDKVVERKGVKIVGFSDLPSRMAPTASQLYGMNLVHFLDDLGGAENFQLDLEDEVTRGALVTHQGEITYPPPKVERLVPKLEPAAPAEEPEPQTEAEPLFGPGDLKRLSLVGLGLLLAFIGFVAPATFVGHLTVFVLACFVGWQVVWNVTASLHTPLMSVTNAISGIILLGAMHQVSDHKLLEGSWLTDPVTILGVIAIVLAAINISGGFLVTQRMLKMFQK
ncbi:MAG: Re/Si-specific NAD(P)(+) transhydrogenase subunit alpha [Polyangiaceae bacterium]|nr:Re/Si-specific NAD(P)(+) transhydrogenase subunit alpha [Polyangiaceae bacterium]